MGRLPFALFLVLLAPAAMCHSEGSFLGRFWRRAKSVFGAAEEAFRPSAAREHGNFDSLGRDAVRTIGAFARRAGLVPDGSSDGLDVKNRTFFGNAAEKFKESVRAIYPGTLWCGDGTRAKSREELGLFKDTDACCREHDECPDGMPAGSEKYGLENTGLFTRSHCDCDWKFFDCLKRADSIISKKIGYTYFTVLGPQCFKEERIVSECAEEVNGKCTVYKFEEGERRKYQWFDSPTF